MTPPHAFSPQLAVPPEEPIDQTGIRWNLYLDPSLADSRGLFDPEIIVRALGPAEAPELYALLGDSNDPEDIERQFQRMVEIAKKRGQAVAIGHPRPATLNVLRERLPGLEKQGIELVRISELVK